MALIGRFISVSRTPVRAAVGNRRFATVASDSALSHLGTMGTIPPHHKASVGCLRTFTLPPVVGADETSRTMGKAMVDTWRRDGIFQIRVTPSQGEMLRQCYRVSKAFFKLPYAEKAKRVDDQSFAGYIASGEELTDGIADYSEIFTVTKDLPESDPRVQNKWPCHGPCPWPNKTYEDLMKQLMELLGESGEKLLQLTALGLGLHSPDALVKLTEDGWHHMRILRFPHVDRTNGKGKLGRGIGAHTDYGLLVIASQDQVGGLFIRPPIEGESVQNWKTSAAGFQENDDKWMFVPPVENTLTVFPGDMMQFLTNNYLPSTLHKVGLNTRERYAFAYFHEPNFSSVVTPFSKYRESIHYGTHFTNMFMRNYADRITAKRIRAENRMEILDHLRNAATQSQQPLYAGQT